VSKEILARGNQMQILTIDDSGTMRGLVRRSLEKLFPGSTIREAEDGKSAIKELAMGRFELIVTDLEMPGMDGRTFLETLKKNALLDRKKILVFSSSIDDRIRAQFKDNPSVAFLAKPATPEEIGKTVETLMGR
jgi:two-component system chemotaxis response regulator CheY